MTKKDFELIARIIRDMPTHAPTLRTARTNAAHIFAARLGETHPKFQRSRFLNDALGENHHNEAREQFHADEQAAERRAVEREIAEDFGYALDADDDLTESERQDKLDGINHYEGRYPNF